MVILHFLSLIEGLQEYNSLVLAKVTTHEIIFILDNISPNFCLFFKVFSHVGPSAVHVATARRPVEASQAMPKLPAAHRDPTQRVSQLQHTNKVLAAFAVQDRHDRDAVIECGPAAKSQLLE
jgi:hypothetical protein